MTTSSATTAPPLSSKSSPPPTTSSPSTSATKPLPSTTDIRSLLHQYISTNHLDLPRQQLLLSRLRQAGLISSPSSFQHTTGFVRPGKRYLQVFVDAGSAFVDEFIEDEVKRSAPALFTVHLHLLHHRHSSHPVVASVEPRFQHTFLFPLQDEDDQLPLAPVASLLSIASPLHLALTRQDARGHQSLVATSAIEWRKALIHGSVALTVSLFSEDELTRPVGLLSMSLSLVPLKLPASPSALPVFVEKAAVTGRLAADASLCALLQQRFQAYSKAWWQEYNLSGPLHQQRLLTLFATSDHGDSAFVCTLLSPTRSLGGVESPMHAARFVRLLGYRREVRVGGGRREVVHSLNSLVARRWGDVEDHCFLLCSLLLGFGMDAFVCTGANAQGVHMVVVTRHDAQHLTLWDAVTGHRHDLHTLHRHLPSRPAPPPLPLTRVFCLFNHRAFHANAQVEDDPRLLDWDVSAPSAWKSMKEDAIAVLPRRSPFALSPCTVEPVTAAAALESQLRHLLAAYRRQLANLSTAWSAHLSHVLTPALASYEMERVCGVAAFAGDFQAAVHHSIDVGSVFRAVPFQFAGVDAGEIMAGMLENETFVGMVGEGEGREGGCVGLEFAVRVKIVPYAEEVIAVWVVVASTQPALLMPNSRK